MTYDRNQDPRSLDEEVESAFPPPDTEERMGRLGAQVATSRVALSLFAHEGWRHFQATVSKRTDKAYEGLRRARSFDETRMYQGRLAELEWLAELPELEETALRSAEDAMAALEGG